MISKSAGVTVSVERDGVTVQRAWWSSLAPLAKRGSGVSGWGGRVTFPYASLIGVEVQSPALLILRTAGREERVAYAPWRDAEVQRLQAAILAQQAR